jgi:glucosamine-6-phosphate deaminase
MRLQTRNLQTETYKLKRAACPHPAPDSEDNVSSSIETFMAGQLAVEIYDSEAAMGAAAATRAAHVLREAVANRGHARAVIATGNSQYAFTDALVAEDVPWSHVTIFHMDEYVGIESDHSASFQRWIRERIEDRLHPAHVEYISGLGDPETEALRYEGALREAPLDLVCMGIGENGHLAFNEPYAADFADERWARVIALTDESKRQQVNEGHFPDLDHVPSHAISLTIPALLSAAKVQVCVPETRKSVAVRATIGNEISTACPSTILRESPQATLFLEPDSAALLGRPVPARS